MAPPVPPGGKRQAFVPTRERAMRPPPGPPGRPPQALPQPPAGNAGSAGKITIKKSVADRVRQLNASGHLNAELRMAPLAKAFAPLETQVALDVLDSLVDAALDAEDP